MPITVRFHMANDAHDLIPTKAHPDDAAFDLKAAIDIVIPPNTPTLVPTGLFLELPNGFEAQVRPRSGLALKHALTVLNSPGTIDAGYRGQVQVIMFNHAHTPFTITRGERIAQLVIQALPEVILTPADTLDLSDRGTGGFGSTGTK